MLISRLEVKEKAGEEATTGVADNQQEEGVVDTLHNSLGETHMNFIFPTNLMIKSLFWNIMGISSNGALERLK